MFDLMKFLKKLSQSTTIKRNIFWFLRSTDLTLWCIIIPQSILFSKNIENRTISKLLQVLHDAVRFYFSNRLIIDTNNRPHFSSSYLTKVAWVVEVKHFPKVRISKQLWCSFKKISINVIFFSCPDTLCLYIYVHRFLSCQQSY